MKYKVYRIDTGITDWFIARNFTELIAAVDECYGEGYLNDEFSEGVNIIPLNNKAELTIGGDIDPKLAGKKTVKEWLEIFGDKPGMLASSEY